ncbi:SPOSA6832_02344 [Sporobolomyces salmonicolor]|uniref:SPOSA6832_02344-mRNA-1:cds n=1 Tax=Sporidiobolus salmonicolor TaxID=5005 RepID=A0A0D6ELY7_SPOSA|nr:SPOSA6832_02344 [Sporobolomyces salmonicolor]
MDIPASSSSTSPAHSMPPTPLASQPGTSSPSPSTSVSVSTTPHRSSRRPPAATTPQDRTRKALDGIRAFLASKSCYDILPESFRSVPSCAFTRAAPPPIRGAASSRRVRGTHQIQRATAAEWRYRLIVFDNKLGITRSLQALVTNGVVSAPLYDSTTQRFAGMFTLADVVHLIQYYYLTAHEYENVVAEVEAFQLESLRSKFRMGLLRLSLIKQHKPSARREGCRRQELMLPSPSTEIEQAIDVPPPPTISVHPDQPLSDACAALVRTHARRLPLVDRDDQTGKETIVSVLTQYRVLKFIAINCAHDCARLDQSIGSLGIGSYVSWYEPPPDLPNLTASATNVSSSQSTSSSAPPAQESASAESPHACLSPLNDASKLPDDPKQQESAQPPEGDAGANSTRADESSGTETPTAEAQGGATSGNAEETLPPSTSTMGVSDRFFPLSTATMQTSVFDVVHIFSERGISAVPIVDEDGVVLNLYETVDVVVSRWASSSCLALPSDADHLLRDSQDLVRQNAYQVLDATIEDAINQRSADFTGVMTCTPSDTLASILTFVRERRCHRFVIVEPEDVPAMDGRPARKRGSLIGILSLSDMLRFLVGHENLKGMEVPGLGVHGLRGVSTVSTSGLVSASGGGGNETDFEGLTDATSSAGGSKMGSRRGSEATASSISLPAAELVGPGGVAVGLEDVIEGQAVE